MLHLSIVTYANANAQCKENWRAALSLGGPGPNGKWSTSKPKKNQKNWAQRVLGLLDDKLLAPGKAWLSIFSMPQAKHFTMNVRIMLHELGLWPLPPHHTLQLCIRIGRWKRDLHGDEYTYRHHHPENATNGASSMFGYH